MSLHDPPPTPSPEPPKSPYDFDPSKWEQHEMAENGGSERESYLGLLGFSYSHFSH